jgi:hypothetical protein
MNQYKVGYMKLPNGHATRPSAPGAWRPGRMRRYSKVEAIIVTGGGFFPLKSVLQNSNPRRMNMWLHEERSSVTPYGAPDQRTMFTPERIAIEKLDGTVVAQRYAPRDSFAGHQMHTPWDPLHRAYFNGEAVWTSDGFHAVTAFRRSFLFLKPQSPAVMN